MRIAPILTLLCLLPLAVNARADWPEFRGPDGQGHAESADLPVRWTSTDNVLWKAPVPGLGWSSPVIVGSRVFLTTAVPLPDGGKSDQSLRTLCLDVDSGSVLWDVEVFQQKPISDSVDRVHGKNSHASPTPVTDGTHLFVHFGVHGTACLNLDGSVVWKNQDLMYVPVHGNGGSPILVGDLLVVACDGGNSAFIAALDRATGVLRWKQDRPDTKLPRTFAFGTPLLIDVAGQPQIISAAAGAVYAHDPKDGSVIWQVDYADGYSVIPRPVYAHGLVYISSGYNTPKLLAIDPTGTGDITATHIRWTMKKAAPHTPSPLVVGDELYVVSDGGIATCVDARTGEELWQQRFGGKFSASPLYAGGHIYFQSEEGEGIVIEPGREFVEVARNQLEPRTFASYAVHASSLLIRTEENLYRIASR